MQEVDIATIKKRSIRGVFSLTSRTFLIQVISQVVTFLLTVYLTPSDYGVFFLVSTVMVFLTYFSDVGLAAALIQKKEDLTEEDLRTTFTIQQLLVGTSAAIGLLLSPVIRNIYHLDSQGVFLYQALVIAFFLSSLKTIPSILLERELKFQRLVIPEIVETLFFNGLVLVLAIQGFGVASFTYAVLARGISGLITMYIIAPWWPRIGINRKVAKSLLSFGIPFQINSILALIKDNLLFLYLGAILSKQALGYIGVAQKWAYIPLRLIMDNLIRITFPSFSRLANNAEYLGRAIEKTLFSITLFIFPFLTGMVILMPYFIHLFPKYHKWEPALLAFVFYAINAILSSISTPLTNALNAIGKIRVTLILMVFWTIATWILTPLFVHLMGFSGVALASALISGSVIIVIYIVKKYVRLVLAPVLLPPLLGTVIMGVVLYYGSKILIHNFPSFFLMIGIGGIVYVITLIAIARNQLIADITMIRENLQK